MWKRFRRLAQLRKLITSNCYYSTVYVLLPADLQASRQTGRCLLPNVEVCWIEWPLPRVLSASIDDESIYSVIPERLKGIPMAVYWLRHRVNCGRTPSMKVNQLYIRIRRRLVSHTQEPSLSLNRQFHRLLSSQTDKFERFVQKASNWWHSVRYFEAIQVDCSSILLPEDFAWIIRFQLFFSICLKSC